MIPFGEGINKPKARIRIRTGLFIFNLNTMLIFYLSFQTRTPAVGIEVSPTKICDPAGKLIS